jgi:hypothetical protein
MGRKELLAGRAHSIIETIFAGASAPAYRVPLLDGPISLEAREDAWRQAAGFDGLARGRHMEERRGRVRIGATASHIYAMVATELPPDGLLVPMAEAAAPQRPDTVEFWIDPSPQQGGAVYQLVLDPQGQTRAMVHRAGAAPESTWSATCKVASRVEKGMWFCAVEIPAAALGRETTLGGAWSVNLCRNFNHPLCRASVLLRLYADAGEIAGER